LVIAVNYLFSENELAWDVAIVGRKRTDTLRNTLKCQNNITISL